MNEQEILESLRTVEFFHDIDEEHLKRVSAISRFVEFTAQQDIFHEDELAKDVYAIISGKVSLVICTPEAGCRQLMVAADGDLIGWSPVVGRHRLSDTAHTLAPTKAIAIDGPGILALSEQHPEFGFEFMKRVAQVLAERLSATRMQILDICGVRLPEVVLESD